MTDEEKSKKYFEDSKDYYDSREPITDRKLRQIYLDGLAEGRKEKWHDLRKDPNDLPESSIFHEVLNQNGIKIYYDDVLKKWNMYFNGEIIQAQTPIAWCEIPTFEV